MSSRNRFLHSNLCALLAGCTIACSTVATTPLISQPPTATTETTSPPAAEPSGASGAELAVEPSRAPVTTAACPPDQVEPPPPPSKPVRIPVLVVPEHSDRIPDGSRIVIAGIEGNCAEEVKSALMRRLIDNRRFSVLTRENLWQVIDETENTYSGKFNTETATKLGQLMGASRWIVGRVDYCGQSFDTSDDETRGPVFSILAALQIIDLETGKLLVSSSSQGQYRPQPVAPFNFAKVATESGSSPGSSGSETQVQPTPGSSSSQSSQLSFQLPSGLASQFSQFGSQGGSQTSSQPSSSPDAEEKTIDGPEEFTRLRAAEDLADEFANRFFGRPTWENVEMWTNQRWKYDQAIRMVKLGHCQQAVRHFQESASWELPFMDEVDTAEYLHNYGVALLCANDVEAATSKLQAAYRIENNPYTLNMLDLAGKIDEWSLKVTIEDEPEVDRLVNTESR